MTILGDLDENYDSAFAVLSEAITLQRRKVIVQYPSVNLIICKNVVQSKTSKVSPKTYNTGVHNASNQLSQMNLNNFVSILPITLHI